MLMVVLVYIVAPVLLMMLWRKRRPVQVPLDPDRPYTVYCRRFDVEVRPDQLDALLGRSRIASQASLVHELDAALATWQIRHQLAALDAAGRVRAAVGQEILRDTVVSILIDHSGSMRGQRMLMTVGAVSLLSDLLDGLKVTQEVLGFTTVRWRGGRSRKAWLLARQPPYPGRLNDILHIVYCEAGEMPKHRNFALMLRPDLLKENIDGEAIEWAASRLRRRAETRKHLIIISDGAPVDDSTLQSNGLAYLENHLKGVIGTLEAEGNIRLSAIGIQHEVSRYYGCSAAVYTPDDFATAMLALVERLLIDQTSAPETEP